MDVSFLKSAFQKNQYPPPDRSEIAFAGKSNVGKSSLINVLVNRKKMARTSSTPGRTQALNFFDIRNKDLRMVDLPGYGFAGVPLQVKRSWGNMVETYLKTRTNLKAVVVILDIRRDASEGDLDLLNWLSTYGIKAIPVITKADKLSRRQAAERAKQIASELENSINETPIIFSAKTREGRDEIWDEIDRAVLSADRC
ncbi:MAG: YihA family ribosome biogenesis GTP-binding protein [Deltaproteobacteria bacterium]|nr:YihA family ribosome biogenesis GTP-binding protein [Deltaproteobacteria bacterium]